MRNRLANAAAVSTMFLTLALSPFARAQQENRRTTGGGEPNPTAGQDKNQASATTETIRGIVAGITAEGEVMFDFRNNRAVAAEAAYLTVVGSPIKADGETTRAVGAATQERGSSDKKRHHIYHVWLTPKTKICEASAQPEKSNAQAETARSEQAKEVSFDKLEVGDHVEIQFVVRDDTTSAGSAHQTEQMRRTHGRDRTHVGYATAVTILPAKDAASHKDEGERKEKSGEK
jgi:hypothetical protein